MDEIWQAQQPGERAKAWRTQALSNLEFLHATDITHFNPMSDLRICFVGDSLTNGTGDPDCLGWTGRVCASAYQSGYPLTYYNLGVRRETSTDIARRWFGEVACRLSNDSDGRVVFSFGVNDTTPIEERTRVSFDDSVDNLRNILQAVTLRFPVLMVGPPPVADSEQNQRIAYLSREFASVCLGLTVPYLEVFTPLQDSSVWMNEVKANDGAHPRASGYAALARLVEQWSAWRAWFDEMEG